MALVLAVALVVAGTSVAFWSSHRQLPVVVDPACPALVTNTSRSTQDFGDTVTWGGRTWWSSEATTTAAAQVGAVTCSVSAMPNENGWRVTSDPWPDGAATLLPGGTTLHLPREDRAGRGLVARTPDGDRLYCRDEGAAEMPAC